MRPPPTDGLSNTPESKLVWSTTAPFVTNGRSIITSELTSPFSLKSQNLRGGPSFPTLRGAYRGEPSDTWSAVGLGDCPTVSFLEISLVPVQNVTDFPRHLKCSIPGALAKYFWSSRLLWSSRSQVLLMKDLPFLNTDL